MTKREFYIAEREKLEEELATILRVKEIKGAVTYDDVSRLLQQKHGKQVDKTEMGKMIDADFRRAKPVMFKLAEVKRIITAIDRRKSYMDIKTKRHEVLARPVVEVAKEA